MPFLLEHGWWLAWVFVALLAALGVGLVVLVRRLLVRRAQAAKVQAFVLGDPFAVDDGELVSGALYGGSVRTTYERGVAESVRAPELWLENQHGRYELPGSIEVVLGASTRTGYRVRGKRGSWRQTTIKLGEQVVMRGTITALPSYRDGARAITPAGGDTLHVYAQHPQARPRALHPMIAGVVVAVITVASWAGLHVLGRLYLARAGYDPANELRGVERPVIGALAPIVIASALPGSRDEALDYLARGYGLESMSPADVDRFVAIKRLAAGCIGEVWARWMVGDLDESMRLDAKCGDHDLALPGLHLHADFEGVLAAPPSENDRYLQATAAVVLGRWVDVARLSRDPCLVDLARHHTGDTGARERLAGSEDIHCRLAAAAITTPYVAVDTGGSIHADVEIACDLDWMHSGRECPGYIGESSLTGGAQYADARRAMLARYAPDDAPHAGLLRAIVEVHRGHYDAAVKLVEQIASEDEKSSIVAAIRERAGVTPADPPPLACKGVGELADAVRDGDAAMLARAFDDCLTSPEQEALAIPHIRALPRARDLVRRVLRDRHSTTNSSLPDLVHYLSMRRDVQRALGEDARAAELQRRIDVILRAFDDRDRAIAIAIFSL